MATTRKLAIQDLNIETAYPRAIETIHFDRNGDILRINFSDGTPSLEHPGHALREQSLDNIDLVGIYHLPAHYVLLQNKSNNRYMYGFHMPSCKIVGDETDEMEGEMVMTIREDLVTVDYPDGQQSDSAVNSLSDLKEKPLENIDVLALRSYALLEYRDRKTQEIWLTVVQSGQGRPGYGT